MHSSAKTKRPISTTSETSTAGNTMLIVLVVAAELSGVGVSVATLGDVATAGTEVGRVLLADE